MRQLFSPLLLVAVFLSVCAQADSAEQYQTPESFVAENFGGSTPEPSVLWITGELRKQAKAILEHDPESLRVHYWRKGKRTAWVLEEIGKERPITTGWIVENDAIQQAKVLIYRESRGREIHQQFFTNQFFRAGLDDQTQLNCHIDGISGATLSVNAMRKMARLALLYHRHAVADVASVH